MITETTGEPAFRYATLPSGEASDLVAAHPELADPASGEPIVVAITVSGPEEAAVLVDFLAAAGEALMQRKSGARKVWQALLAPDATTVGAGIVRQVQRNAAAQSALAREFGLLTSAEVAHAASSRASNVAALASRWRREGSIFAVDMNGKALYPGYQFDDEGRPRPVVAGVLDVLGNGLSGWELALWFVASNVWLGGERPVDVLEVGTDEVLMAATRLAEELPA